MSMQIEDTLHIWYTKMKSFANEATGMLNQTSTHSRRIQLFALGLHWELPLFYWYMVLHLWM